MNSYKELYKKLDPIFKKYPKITWAEFCKKHPALSKKISNWSFGDRRKKILGQPGYGRKNIAPVNVDGAKPNVTENVIKKFIKDNHPTSKHKSDFFKIAQALLNDPKTPHSALAKVVKKNGKVKKNKNGTITVNDAQYYKFRAEFNEFSGSVAVKSSVSGSDVKSSGKYATRKKNGLYRVLFEQSSAGIEKKSRELLNNFIEKINEEKMANLELIETSFPEQKIEVRSYAK